MKKSEKKLWINNLKKQLLKDENRYLQEIDQALNNLYDNLNEEYKEEISKNPELILYYIFTDIGASESYTTPFNIRNCNLEDDYNKINNITKKKYITIL